ncbi:MAG: methyl-accepting chemotaxis protein [Wenzhouxiangella sp.]
MSRASNKGASQKLSGFQVLLFVLLAALLAAVSGNFYLLNESARQEAEYLSLTTAIQVGAQQLARTASEASQGDVDALADLAGLRTNIDQAVGVLRNGAPDRALPPSPDTVNASLATLEDIWRRINDDANELVARADLLIALAEAGAGFAAAAPRLQAVSDQVVQRLIATGAAPQQVYVASRQLALAERMQREAGNIMIGGSGAMTAADGFSRNAALFESVLQALLEGEGDGDIAQVQDDQASAALQTASDLFAGLRADLDTILSASTDLYEVRQAADEISLDAEDLTTQAAVLAAEYGALGQVRLWPSLTAGIVLAGATLLVLFLLGLGAYRNQQRSARLTAEINQRNQDAILRLLDEMSSLADGDLTVQATVTEDVTGAIADSVNYAVEALRDLVAEVNSTARQVAAQAQETRATTIQLAESSEHQAREIGKASDNINAMARSFDDMAGRSSESAEVAQSSVEIANRGADMVRQTIAGMDNIRNQIQETSKRIKRLGESSQEIGDIVELINGLSEQTNVLALNAAIQAASAGGAGRGFAVVADEVQRLAERATDATRRIEALVQTIQSDTAEAVNSMEETTAQVVSGARLAEDAGEALESIERVSNDLAGLIQNISGQAQEDSRNATRIAGMMNGIRDISVQTSEGTSQTAASVASLAELVRQLRESVADFKLPEDDKA